MTTQKFSLLAAAVLLSGSAVAQQGADTPTRQGQGKTNAAQVAKATGAWPKASRDAIKFMTDKYGAPAAVTADAVMWGKTGPWKRTLVFRVEVAHQFPKAHSDVMQQWIDYKAPWDKYDELAAYDGSVVLERTAGEMSARCDKEAANFLALNLADEVARGKRTVDDARMKYGEQIKAMMSMKPAPYTEKLMFNVSGKTQDADRSLPGM